MILLNVEPSDGTPIYLQIVDQVRRLVDDEAVPVGTSLPSTRSLAERLGVNRSTVYRAYQELWALGYLDSTPGSYTRVRARVRVASARSQTSAAVAWDQVSSDPSRRLFERFLSYRPEGAADAAHDEINLSRLDLDPRLFPTEDLRRSLNRVLSRQGPQVLCYGDCQGSPELRECVAERARTHGMTVRPEEVLITNGSQQAIDLVFRTLTSPGQRVAIEEPTYANVIPLARYHQLQVQGIPMGPDGLDLDALSRSVDEATPALVYTIPNFQNPTGITSTQTHREALLGLCQRHHLPLVEDGFEEEMKYFGRVSLPIKSMDAGGVVIYLGTFSKVLFPGLRVGWVLGDAELVRRVTAVKRFTDLTTSPLVQAALADFCRQGHYERHIRRMHRVFRRRMQVALEAAQEHLPRELVRWTEPSGGYLIWVTLTTPGGDEQRLQEVCTRHGVRVSPGSYYFSTSSPRLHFRLSISRLEEDSIVEGVARLGKALRAYAREV